MNDRLITNNVLVAFETMHHISQRKVGNIGEMTLKLDMSKAYDRVEWECLEKIMERLVFAPRWRGLMMQCISSITYSIKINGKLSGKITPLKGLRQGDHLSPYLFPICAEGLSALIKKVVFDGTMEGIFVGRDDLGCLIFFFFVDDGIILCKATTTK